MNKEVIKAMNRKEKKVSNFRKWWRKNDYKVLRIIFFYIWFYQIISEKITNWLNNRQKWSEERANEILNYYIPRRASWVEDEQEFYFFDNGFGWNRSFAKKYLKRKDRRFWSVNTGYCGGDMRQYLMNKFELEGFTKEVIDTSPGTWTEIIFKKI